MKRAYSFYLQDIFKEIAHIEAFVQGLDFDAFSQDEKTIYAVTRSLQIIGEAAGKIPSEFQARHPNVPWREMRNFRNVVVHKYWDVDLDIAWDIIEHRLAPLKKQITLLDKESWD